MTPYRSSLAAGALGALTILVPAMALGLVTAYGLALFAVVLAYVGLGDLCAYYAGAGTLGAVVWRAAWPLLAPVYLAALGARTLERRHHHERTRRRLKAQYFAHADDPPAFLPTDWPVDCFASPLDGAPAAGPDLDTIPDGMAGDAHRVRPPAALMGPPPPGPPPFGTYPLERYTLDAHGRVVGWTVTNEPGA